MKKSKFILTLAAFAFAIVGAFASQMDMLVTDDEGVTTGACSAIVSLNEGDCHENGSGNQCTLVGSNAPAYSKTACTTPMTTLP